MISQHLPFWNRRRRRINMAINTIVTVLSVLSLALHWAYVALLAIFAPFTIWVIVNIIVGELAMRRIRAEVAEVRAKYKQQP